MFVDHEIQHKRDKCQPSDGMFSILGEFPLVLMSKTSRISPQELNELAYNTYIVTKFCLELK